MPHPLAPIRVGLLLVGLLPFCGCCAISKLGPTDENEVAARELARLGLDAMHRDQCVEAHARFSRALEKCPTNPQARHHLATLLWQQGDHRRAIEEMGIADANCGGNPDWQVQQGRWLLAQDQLGPATDCARRALHRMPNHPLAWRLLGDVHKRQSRFNEALAAYHRAASTANESSTTWMSMAEIYRLQGRPRRALAMLRRIQQQPTENVSAKTLAQEQALALRALGRVDDAIDVLLASQQEAIDVDLTLLVAECQMDSGRHGDAARSLRSLGEIDDQRLADLRQKLVASTQQLTVTH